MKGSEEMFTMDMVSLAVGVAFGVVFATVCLTIERIIYEHRREIEWQKKNMMQ